MRALARPHLQEIGLGKGVGVWIDAEHAAELQRALMPAPVKIEPPGI